MFCRNPFVVRASIRTTIHNDLSGLQGGSRNPFVVRASIRTKVILENNGGMALLSQSLRSQGIDSDNNEVWEWSEKDRRNPFVVRASIRTDEWSADWSRLEYGSQSLRSQGIDSDFELAILRYKTEVLCRNPFVVRASIRTEIINGEVFEWSEKSQSLRSQGIDSDAVSATMGMGLLFLSQSLRSQGIDSDLLTKY